jgi:hypothetical protein
MIDGKHADLPISAANIGPNRFHQNRTDLALE